MDSLLLNILGGFIASIAFAVFYYFIAKIKHSWGKRKPFSELLDRIGENVYLILPSLGSNEMSPRKHSGRTVRIGKRFPFYAENDFRAAIILDPLLRIVFDKVELKNHEIRIDDLPFHKNIFFIGGPSNDGTWQMLSSSKPPIHFTFDQQDWAKENVQAHYFKYRDDEYSDAHMVSFFFDAYSKKQWPERNRVGISDEYEYGLILHSMSQINGNSYYLIAGMSSEGTIITTQYFVNKWQDIRKQLIKQTRKKWWLVPVLFYTFFRWCTPEYALILKIRNRSGIESEEYIVKNRN